MNCETCQGVGYVSVEVKRPDGSVTSYAKPCDHGRGAGATAGGFMRAGEGVAQLLDNLSPIARRVRAIILTHRGEASPVTVAEISAALGIDDRSVKQAVADLTTLGKMLIGSSRDSTRPGYFLISSDDELNRQRTHCLHHVQAWLARLKVYDPNGAAARELYGQLRAEFETRAEMVNGELPTAEAQSEPDSAPPRLGGELAG